MAFPVSVFIFVFSFVPLILAVGLRCSRLRTPPPLPGHHTSVSGNSAIASCHDNMQHSFPAVSEKVSYVRINWSDGLSAALVRVTHSSTLYREYKYTLERISLVHSFTRGFPGGSDSEESAYSDRDLGLIPGLGRYPGEINGNPPTPAPQCSCLKNPMDRGAWQATVHGVTKSGHD